MFCFVQFADAVARIDVQVFSCKSVLHNAAFGELYVYLAAEGKRFRKKKFAQTCVGVSKNMYSLTLYCLKGELILVRTRKACSGVA